jgi:hypothetical protein
MIRDAPHWSRQHLVTNKDNLNNADIGYLLWSRNWVRLFRAEWATRAVASTRTLTDTITGEVRAADLAVEGETKEFVIGQTGVDRSAPVSIRPMPATLATIAVSFFWLSLCRIRNVMHGSSCGDWLGAQSKLPT